jgi:hypothetical protein
MLQRERLLFTLVPRCHLGTILDGPYATRRLATLLALVDGFPFLGFITDLVLPESGKCESTSSLAINYVRLTGISRRTGRLTPRNELRSLPLHHVMPFLAARSLRMNASLSLEM